MAVKRNKLLDAIAVRYEDIGNRLFAGLRRRKLSNTDFTIISNNCWGGHVYRRYGLEYKTPTVGLYFYADDYVKFLSKLRFYLEAPLTFIDVNSSAHRDELIRKGQENVIIGTLNNEVEIVFLHYKSRDEAYEKWTRRAKRVNYDNLIVKFSQMNNCRSEHLEYFDSLPFEKKVMFTAHTDEYFPCAAAVQRYTSGGQVIDDTTYFARHVNLEKLINEGVIKNVIV